MHSDLFGATDYRVTYIRDKLSHRDIQEIGCCIPCLFWPSLASHQWMFGYTDVCILDVVAHPMTYSSSSNWFSYWWCGVATHC